MKRLTLLRHANADWKDSNVADFDRPLNRRGVAEAEAIARYLIDAELVPDLLLTSPAKRAQQTTDIVARKLALSPRSVKAIEPLYLARCEDILALVRTTGPRVAHVAVVGHNPGISELARFLAPDANLKDLPTAGACLLTFPARNWAGVAPRAARALQYEPPASRLFGLWA